MLCEINRSFLKTNLEQKSLSSIGTTVFNYRSESFEKADKLLLMRSRVAVLQIDPSNMLKNVFNALNYYQYKMFTVKMKYFI